MLFASCTISSNVNFNKSYNTVVQIQIIFMYPNGDPDQSQNIIRSNLDKDPYFIIIN